jgi:hypothetical protein
VDFAALDGKPVSIVFSLISPAEARRVEATLRYPLMTNDRKT